MARQISVTLARPGMQLARSVYDDKGRVLLQAGVKLSEYHIHRLRNHMAVITIEDEISEGIVVHEVIPQELRVQVQKTLEEEWSRLRSQVSFKRVSFSASFAKSMRLQVRSLLEVMRGTQIIKENMASLAGYDNGTYVHSVNVTIYSLIIGVALGLSETMLMDLAIGALCHDIGKTLIPASILTKRGPLTPDEYRQMKDHAAIGYRILKQQHEFSVIVSRCAHEHHERINGSGYPRGITGEQIHYLSKIVAIADVYDAMVMHRPYREGVPPGDVMEYLFSRAGSEFDFHLVQLFGKRVVPYPIGTEVTLSDGSVGIISNIDTDMPARPTVRIIRLANGTSVSPREVDLMKQLNVTIIRSSSVSVLEGIE